MKTTPYIPCDSYNIDYDEMNSQQKKFYFYFRTMMIQGKNIKTYAYYIVLLATELLLGYRDFSPKQVQKYLLRLLDSYWEYFEDIHLPLFMYT